MKIYTKKGDTGTTALIGGTRVPKYDLRIEAYGTVDELNSWIGMLGDAEAAAPHLPLLRSIQDNLFTIGSHLATDPEKKGMKLPEVTETDVEALEHSMDAMEEHLPPLRNFVLPGGHPANSQAHVARCVCRRAERLVVHLNEESPVNPVILRYLNRLSDWLFMFSREMSFRTGSPEIPWTPRQD